MPRNNSKSHKKSTSGQTTRNDNQGRPFQDASVHESEEHISPRNSMATDLPDGGDALGSNPYQTGLSRSSGFVSRFNPGQMPPHQHRSMYPLPVGQSMPNYDAGYEQNPFLQPPPSQPYYDAGYEQNPFLQPPSQPYNNIGRIQGLPNDIRSIYSQETRFGARPDDNQRQTIVTGTQRGNRAVTVNAYDPNLLFPTHLPDQERHARGIFTPEELAERGMLPPAQLTQRRRRIGPEALISPEESPIAPARWLNPEAMDATWSDHREITDVTSEADREEEETTVAPTEADDDEHTNSGGTKNKRKNRKRAGSPLAGNPQAGPKKPHLHHGILQRQPDGTLWFRATGSDILEPTVRHEPNRADMIADASARGHYTHAPAMGRQLPHDITSYLESQREWYAGDRPHDWHRSLGLLYQFQRGDTPFRFDPLGPLRWRGAVVLNNQDEVMTDLPDLPLTLSSQLEGFRLEMYVRLDHRITINEIFDRMPSARDGSRPVSASAISNRRLRFRERNGLVSWEHRDGTAEYLETVRARLSPEQLANNSTKGFLGLSESKLKEIREKNRVRDQAKQAKKKAATPAICEQRAARGGAGLSSVDMFTETEPSDQSLYGSQRAISEPETPGYARRSHEDEDGEYELETDMGSLYEEEEDVDMDPPTPSTTPE